MLCDVRDRGKGCKPTSSGPSETRRRVKDQSQHKLPTERLHRPTERGGRAKRAERADQAMKPILDAPAYFRAAAAGEKTYRQRKCRAARRAARCCEVCGRSMGTKSMKALTCSGECLRKHRAQTQKARRARRRREELTAGGWVFARREVGESMIEVSGDSSSLSTDPEFHAEVLRVVKLQSATVDHLYATRAPDELVVLMVEVPAFERPWQILEADMILLPRSRLQETFPGNTVLLDAWDQCWRTMVYRPLVVAAGAASSGRARVTILAMGKVPAHA